jgi:hypothetical protein
MSSTSASLETLLRMKPLNRLVYELITSVILLLPFSVMFAGMVNALLINNKVDGQQKIIF